MRSSIVLCLKKTSVFFENPNLGSTWLKPISPFHIWCHDSMIRLAFLAHFKCGEALRFTIGSRAELSVSQGAASAKRCRWFRTKSKNPARSMNFLHEYIHPVHLQSFLASFESWKFLESICICFQGQHPACRSRRHHAKWGRRPSVSGLPKLKNAVGWNHVGRCWIYIYSLVDPFFGCLASICPMSKKCPCTTLAGIISDLTPGMEPTQNPQASVGCSTPQPRQWPIGRHQQDEVKVSFCLAAFGWVVWWVWVESGTFPRTFYAPHA